MVATEWLRAPKARGHRGFRSRSRRRPAGERFGDHAITDVRLNTRRHSLPRSFTDARQSAQSEPLASRFTKTEPSDRLGTGQTRVLLAVYAPSEPAVGDPTARAATLQKRRHNVVRAMEPCQSGRL
jgi:hypothetical protein